MLLLCFSLGFCSYPLCMFLVVFQIKLMCLTSFSIFLCFLIHLLNSFGTSQWFVEVFEEVRFNWMLFLIFSFSFHFGWYLAKPSVILVIRNLIVSSSFFYLLFLFLLGLFLDNYQLFLVSSLKIWFLQFGCRGFYYWTR